MMEVRPFSGVKEGMRIVLRVKNCERWMKEVTPGPAS
jgi:hypothetical protein